MVVAFSSYARILGGGSTKHSPALSSFNFFFFRCVSACAHQFHPSGQGSVHSGSASWDDCGQIIPDELCVSSFFWWVLTLCLRLLSANAIRFFSVLLTCQSQQKYECWLLGSFSRPSVSPGLKTSRSWNSIPRSGELRTQKLKSLLGRAQSLNVLLLKPGVGQYTAIHVTLTARDFFLAYFYPSGPFTGFFSKPSPDFIVPV